MKGIDGFDGKSVDVDFAVGSVLGTRSFGVDEEGYLTGITFKKRHLPGENVAECSLCSIKEELNESVRRLKQFIDKSGLEDVDGIEEEPVPTMAECGHGFWAYFDRKHDFGGIGTVPGVIEGYGEVIIGEKGFRSSKSRVLALVDPTKDKTRGFAYHQHDMKYIGLAFFINLALFLLNLFNGFNGNSPSFSFAAITLFAMFLLIPQGLETLRSLKVLKMVEEGKPVPEEYSSLASTYREEFQIREKFDLVRKNYPDVRFFNSRKEMLKAFPQLKHERKKWEKASK